VALTAIATFLIVFYMLGISIGFLCTYATYYFLKHVFYPRVYKYIRGTTRYYTLLVLALLVGNVVCLIDNRTKILQ
jgi:Mn2+/Fe2+ NRAMP family transporter